MNNIGSYECKCKNGFNGTGKNNDCYDLDECKTNMNDCHENSDCLNIVGSYECVCKNGFYGNGTYCEGLYNLLS